MSNSDLNLIENSESGFQVFEECGGCIVSWRGGDNNENYNNGRLNNGANIKKVTTTNASTTELSTTFVVKIRC